MMMVIACVVAGVVLIMLARCGLFEREIDNLPGVDYDNVDAATLDNTLYPRVRLLLKIIKIQLVIFAIAAVVFSGFIVYGVLAAVDFKLFIILFSMVLLGLVAIMILIFFSIKNDYRKLTSDLIVIRARQLESWLKMAKFLSGNRWTE
ncbi:MAG: hypothetical protein LBL08_01875 [Candidatus Nomurabacteria bacterium]|jgi:hypothetical protein|nr:hypothetical protein [Candidatus Nomurabacteria bacterium]